MANRNRSAGHAWELKVINMLKELGYSAVSSRYESRSQDDAGVDIVSDFPLKIQCKISQNQPGVHDVLTNKECDVIFFRKVEKADKNFISKGDYAMLKLDDLLNLIGEKS